MIPKIIFDTNVLSKGNFDELQSLCDFLKENRSLPKVKVCIPEIVLLEWQEHQRLKIKDINSRAKNILGELKEVGHPKIDIQEIDPVSYVKELTKRQFDRFPISIEMILIPEIKKDELVQRAIRKIPPFNPKRTGSDFGFKDTVLFFSIREEAKSSPENTFYILMTKDSGFGDTVINEFKFIRKELMIIDDLPKLKDELDIRLKLGLGLARKRAQVETLISDKRETFDVYLITRAIKENPVTTVNREIVDGYSFSSFYIDDFDETRKNFFKVSGRIIADISYKKKEPGARNGFNGWDPRIEGQNAFALENMNYSTFSAIEFGRWNNPWLQQHETFLVNLEVNIDTAEIRIL